MLPAVNLIETVTLYGADGAEMVVAATDAKAYEDKGFTVEKPKAKAEAPATPAPAKNAK